MLQHLEIQVVIQIETTLLVIVLDIILQRRFQFLGHGLDVIHISTL